MDRNQKISPDNDETESDYKVGYRRPPKHRQFQSGQSGNPRGRPKGVRTLAETIRKIMGQRVSVTENGRTSKILWLEAVLRRLANEVARGDVRSLRLFLQLIERHGEAVSNGVDQDILGAEDLAILRHFLPEAVEADVAVETTENNKDSGGRDDT